MPDYALGEEMGPLGGIIAILVGTIVAFVLVLGAAKLVASAKKQGQ
jgi:cobalt/nickel transport protein